jgi:hypothetical protein
MATLPITQYIPKKFDHIARLTNVVKGSTYKHHGIIIKPDTSDVIKSHVCHYWGNDKPNSTVRVDTLEFFLEGFTQLCVYDHSTDLLDEQTIEENIKKFSERKEFKYDILNFNCEDVVCQIILKEKHGHKKQSDNHSYWRLSKIGCIYAMTYCNIYSLPNDLSIDPDPNPKKIYLL